MKRIYGLDNHQEEGGLRTVVIHPPHRVGY
jgi:hypothetical protein